MGTSNGRYNSFDSELKEELENKLTATSSLKNRKDLGQFNTPQFLADQITSKTLKYVDFDEKISFLEPSIGSGNFLASLLKSVPCIHIGSATGVDIDNSYIALCKQVYTGNAFKFINADFTSLNLTDKKYNLIITNPPYIRHQKISKNIKNNIRHKIDKLFGIHISGYSDIYVYFLLLSSLWLTDGGTASFLIPSTFMETNYGISLKTFLLKNVTLVHIHTYDNSAKYFKDATIPLSVVIFKKIKSHNHKVTFSFGDDINHPDTVITKETDLINADDKWTNFKNKSYNFGGTKIGDLFTTRRGIATGGNNFFILSEQKTKELKLEREILTPILPSPRNLSVDYLDADDIGLPKINEKYFLVNARLYPDELRKKYPNAYKYLMTEKDKISTRYIPSKRKVWFWQEKREPAPILLAYFSRESSSNSGYRFIRNNSVAIANNSYTMLYPKVTLSSKELDDVFEILTNLSKEKFQERERHYGGGLKKIEPNELLQIEL